MATRTKNRHRRGTRVLEKVAIFDEAGVDEKET